MKFGFLKDNYRVFLLITFFLCFAFVSYKWIDNKKVSETLETYNTSTGSVDFSLVYKDHNEDYIPQDNEEFSINVIAKPNEVNFIGGTFVISYNKNELEFVNGNILAELSEMEEITVDNLNSQTNIVRTSIGFLSSKTINTQTPILELKFKKIGTQESTIEIVANKTEIAIEEESTNELGGITNLVIKKKQENSPSSGNVDLSLSYSGKSSSYIPQQNEEFDVNVVVKPNNGSKFIGGTLGISYNKFELEFVSGTVLAELSELEEITIDSEKTKITTSVGFLSNKTIDTQTSILKLKFKRINKNLTSINFLNNTQIATEESSENELGNISGLEIKSLTSTPSPTPHADCYTCSNNQCVFDAGCRMSGPRCTGPGENCPIQSNSYELVPFEAEMQTFISKPYDSYGISVFLKNAENGDYIFDLSDFDFIWEVSDQTALSLESEYEDKCEYTMGTFEPCSNLNAKLRALKVGNYLITVHAHKKSEDRIVASTVIEVTVNNRPIFEDVKIVSFAVKIFGLENKEHLNMNALVTIKDEGNLVFNNLIGFTATESGIPGYFISEPITFDENVLGNDMTIIIKGEKHLAKMFNGINISNDNENVIVLNGILVPGDLPFNKNGTTFSLGQQDGKINLDDYRALVSKIGSSEVNDLKIGDLNYDGIVDTNDKAIFEAVLWSQSDIINNF